MVTRALPAGLALLAVAAGCSDAPVDTLLTTDDFDRRCAYDDECVVVFPGDVCGCSCDPAAISLGFQDEWREERSRLESFCSDVPDCAACPDSEAICVGWVCEIR